MQKPVVVVVAKRDRKEEEAARGIRKRLKLHETPSRYFSIRPAPARAELYQQQRRLRSAKLHLPSVKRQLAHDDDDDAASATSTNKNDDDVSALVRSCSVPASGGLMRLLSLPLLLFCVFRLLFLLFLSLSRDLCGFSRRSVGMEMVCLCLKTFHLEFLGLINRRGLCLVSDLWTRNLSQTSSWRAEKISMCREC